MPNERLARQVLLVKPIGNWPIGHPKPRWSYYISDLAWSHLSVELAGLSELLLTVRYSKS